MGQVETSSQMLSYGFVPVVLAALIGFAVLWVAHARGMKHAGTGLGEHKTYAKLATAALFVVGLLLALATVDSWTVVRWAGGNGLDTGAYRDPVFGKPLAFYFFELPFYSLLLRFVLGVSVLTAIVHWLTARGWTLKGQAADWREGGIPVDVRDLDPRGALESAFLRGVASFSPGSRCVTIWTGMICCWRTTARWWAWIGRQRISRCLCCGSPWPSA